LVDTIGKSEDTIDNSREHFIKKPKDKKTSLVKVDTIEKAEYTIGTSREPVIKKVKRLKKEAFCE